MAKIDKNGHDQHPPATGDQPLSSAQRNAVDVLVIGKLTKRQRKRSGEHGKPYGAGASIIHFSKVR